jgi:hypothetical protein
LPEALPLEDSGTWGAEAAVLPEEDVAAGIREAAPAEIPGVATLPVETVEVGTDES